MNVCSFLMLMSLIEGGKSLDELFQYAPSARLVSEGQGKDSPLRAGWMLLYPSDDDFDALQSILMRGRFNDRRGWDYLDLPVQYPGWKSIGKSSEQWNFYGSELEQGEHHKLGIRCFQLSARSHLMLSCIRLALPLLLRAPKEQEDFRKYC